MWSSNVGAPNVTCQSGECTVVMLALCTKAELCGVLAHCANEAYLHSAPQQLTAPAVQAIVGQ